MYLPQSLALLTPPVSEKGQVNDAATCCHVFDPGMVGTTAFPRDGQHEKEELRFVQLGGCNRVCP
jgi:hypothetical protein